MFAPLTTGWWAIPLVITILAWCMAARRTPFLYPISGWFGAVECEVRLFLAFVVPAMVWLIYLVLA